MSRVHRRNRRAAATVSWALATAAWAAGCSQGPSRETKDYCAALAEQQVLLVLPVESAIGVADTVDRYLGMANRAPLAVAEPWQRLAALMQIAATIDVNDPAKRLEVIQQAYETKRDADAIVSHAQQTCNISIDTSGTTTTTLAPTTTAPPTTSPATAPAPVPPPETSVATPAAQAPETSTPAQAPVETPPAVPPLESVVETSAAA